MFWHTQGSGKSLSMLFFTQKVLRKLPGNWTFVIVTDRNELDDQVYGSSPTPARRDARHVQPTSGEHLRELLAADHRYVFTLIQKFRTEPGEPYPVLSEPLRHRRDHRRGAPQPVRHPGAEHAQRAAQRRRSSASPARR